MAGVFFFFCGGGSGFVGLRRKMCECEFVGGERERERERERESERINNKERLFKRSGKKKKNF